MKQTILDMIHMNMEYTGNGMYMALYFVTLLFLAFYVKDKFIKDRLLWQNVLVIIGVDFAIPFIHNFIRGIYDDEIRARFFWIFMVPAIAAVGLTLFVDGIKEEWKRILAVVCIVPVIFFCGVFKLSNSMYSPAENPYRLPQDVLNIADEVLSEEESPSLIVPYEISHVFRQYSTDINLMYGENATYGRICYVEESMRHACALMASSFPDLDYIGEMAEEYGADFIVFDSVYHDFGNDTSVNIYGYEEDVNFAGDRSPIVDVSSFEVPEVVGEGDAIHWDLSSHNLEYVDTFGQYLLYRYI